MPEVPWEPSAPCPLPVRVPRLMMVFLPGHTGAVQHKSHIFGAGSSGTDWNPQGLTELGAASQVMLSRAKSGDR